MWCRLLLHMLLQLYTYYASGGLAVDLLAGRFCPSRKQGSCILHGSCGWNLRPLLKGETLKKWLGDIFENGSGAVFQTSLKKGGLVSNYFGKGSIFKLFLKKYPTWGPGPGWTGARAQDPGPNRVWYFFKLSLKMDYYC